MSSLKARVLVAVAGIPFLLLVLGWAPDWATMLLLAGMCAIGAWELMHAVAGEAGKPLLPLAVSAAALVPVCVYLELSIENTALTALPVLPLTALLGAVLVLALFVASICRYGGERPVPFAGVCRAGVPADAQLPAAAADGVRQRGRGDCRPDHGLSSALHLLWQRYHGLLCGLHPGQA